MMKDKEKKKLWFKARNYGWGWTPASREGWLVILLYLIIVIGVSYFFDPENLDSLGKFAYFGFVVVVTLSLISICYKTGEKPEWRWGKK